ncbi:hypothetical protein [Streptomyces meridianus]|uniref:Uncharacterized protein n=1 Tax=Streptomyces meridianus TaxID=2938945 RepID=A0ABT0XBH4_9ACTN|nr:hypothetical protein [Streptomyces meridianus]MCM2579288.1 hypothetical protein [Streptomyces meridianus]
MSRRLLLTAASLAAALLTLTACGPDEGSDDAQPATPTATTSPAPTASPSDPATSAAPTASASDPAGLPAGDEGPSAADGCAAPSLPPGNRVLEVTAKPSGGVVKAQATRYSCGMNGGSYHGAGAVKAYRLAGGAGFELATDGAKHRKASLAEVSRVIDACVSSADANYCRDNIFTVTTDSSGRITRMSQVWHS